MAMSSRAGELEHPFGIEIWGDKAKAHINALPLRLAIKAGNAPS